MTISADDVRKVAQLSRLALAHEEIERYRRSLEDILAYVESLARVDTEGVEPMTHAVPTQMRLREDRVEQRLTRDECLANAPAAEDGMFRVPKIVDAG